MEDGPSLEYSIASTMEGRPWGEFRGRHDPKGCGPHILRGQFEGNEANFSWTFEGAAEHARPNLTFEWVTNRAPLIEFLFVSPDSDEYFGSFRRSLKRRRSVEYECTGGHVCRRGACRGRMHYWTVSAVWMQAVWNKSEPN